MIDTAISCNDDVNKLIMNNYVQKEVCSQIKNFPPSETILAKPVEPVPSPTFSPIDFDDDKDKYFLTNEKGYAPF